MFQKFMDVKKGHTSPTKVKVSPKKNHFYYIRNKEFFIDMLFKLIKKGGVVFARWMDKTL